MIEEGFYTVNGVKFGYRRHDTGTYFTWPVQWLEEVNDRLNAALDKSRAKLESARRERLALAEAEHRENIDHKRYVTQWLDENVDAALIAEFKVEYPKQFEAEWRHDEFAWHICAFGKTEEEALRIRAEYKARRLLGH